jgi:hypothetical protein
MPPKAIRPTKTTTDTDGDAGEPYADQLEELAFTITGWAYEHGILDREEFAEITTYTPSSVNYAVQLEEWAKQDVPFYPPRPSIESTELERQTAISNGTVRCMLVGLISPCEPKDVSVWSGKPASRKFAFHKSAPSLYLTISSSKGPIYRHTKTCRHD